LVGRYDGKSQIARPRSKIIGRTDVFFGRAVRFGTESGRVIKRTVLARVLKLASP
jgi:hypothetical protein